MTVDPQVIAGWRPSFTLTERPRCWPGSRSWRCPSMRQIAVGPALMGNGFSTFAENLLLGQRRLITLVVVTLR
jgi:hypothetical protein